MRPDTGFPGQIDHTIAYCGTAGLLGLGYPAAKSRFGTIVMLISLAAALEVAQLWVPGRHSQFIDFATSAVGTCLGMLAAVVAHRVTLADLR
jgi:VanZ family protein